MNAAVLSRRSLLKAGGAIALSFDLLGPAAGQTPPRLPGSLQTNRRLGAWLAINADGTVTLMTGKVELGQGILTALSQICAEELDVALARIRVISGDTGVTPNEGVTAGSFSMPNAGTAVQYASAEVRQILVNMAAQALGAEPGALTVEDGTVRAPGGRGTTYWALSGGRAIMQEATAGVRPKDPARYRVVGAPVPRLDLPAKLTGRPAFVQDLRPDGMAHGRVVRPPRYRARLAAVDGAAVEAMPGVLKVVRNGSFLGVIATREEQAIAAADALRAHARWEGGGTSLPGYDGVYDWLRAQPAKDLPIKADNRSDTRNVARRIEATYRRPYQMHASIGPSAALGVFADGALTIDTHSQSVFETRAAIARLVNLTPDKVRLRHVDGSGCYGHNGADDVAADVALLAMALPGRPVRLQWMRDDEHAWEPYGSAMLVNVKAGLAQDGAILDWDYELWSTAHSTRPGGNPGNLLAGHYVDPAFAQPVPGNGGAPNYAADRNAIALYDFPGHRVTTHFIEAMPVRVSALRGLGAYANVFAIESFMDELAFAANADPVAYRLRHMRDPRARAVIEAAAERFGWSGFARTGRNGRGFAFARYKNTAAYTAVAVEVYVDRDTGAVQVLRAVAANDSGQIVNPDGIANQIEGGIVQSISWTLKEQVRFDQEKILTRDWASYPILTFSEAPEIDIVQINRPGQPFLGTGEASQGPTGAAVANAIFDARGVRLRDLPLTPAKVKAALN
jgi:CO/xanthine dehydrogenase Mo-binding subunit